MRCWHCEMSFSRRRLARPTVSRLGIPVRCRSMWPNEGRPAPAGPRQHCPRRSTSIRVGASLTGGRSVRCLRRVVGLVQSRQHRPGRAITTFSAAAGAERDTPCDAPPIGPWDVLPGCCLVGFTKTRIERPVPVPRGLRVGGKHPGGYGQHDASRQDPNPTTKSKDRDSVPMVVLVPAMSRRCNAPSQPGDTLASRCHGRPAFRPEPIGGSELGGGPLPTTNRPPSRGDGWCRASREGRRAGAGCWAIGDIGLHRCRRSAESRSTGVGGWSAKW